MNCSEFEKNLVDVVASTNDALPPQVQAHLLQCERCALRLQQEKALTSVLRGIARADENLGLPLAAEMKLLTAFRAAHAPAAPVVTAEILPFVRRSRFAWWQWATVAAVVLLAVIGVARFIQPAAPVQNQPQVVAGGTPAPAPTRKQALPAPNVPDVAPQFVNVNQRGNEMPVRPKIVKKNFVPVPRRNDDRVTAEVTQFEIAEPEQIAAQDFMVFDYARTMPPPERNQIMRVKFPREKIAPLGIPIPPQLRNRDFINTDLLVGSDGVPRAIRVVNR